MLLASISQGEVKRLSPRRNNSYHISSKIYDSLYWKEVRKSVYTVFRAGQYLRRLRRSFFDRQNEKFIRDLAPIMSVTQLHAQWKTLPGLPAIKHLVLNHLRSIFWQILQNPSRKPSAPYPNYPKQQRIRTTKPDQRIRDWTRPYLRIIFRGQRLL